MINLQQCITDLKKSKYWNLLFEKYEVLMIQVVGSQLTEYIDDRSDVDILVICSNSPEYEEPILRLNYEGHSVHWYYINYKNYFELSNRKILRQVSQYTIKYISENNVLYFNEKFKPALQHLLDNKHEISKVGAKRFALLMDDCISKTLSKNLSEDCYTKWLSHLMIAYSVLADVPVSADLMLAIKRIRWLPTTDEQRTQCCEILRSLQSLVANEDIDELTKNLQQYLTTMTSMVK